MKQFGIITVWIYTTCLWKLLRARLRWDFMMLGLGDEKLNNVSYQICLT